MKKKLFLLPLTILLSLGMAGCNNTQDDDMCYGCSPYSPVCADYWFYTYNDFNDYYNVFKEYNDPRYFAPNSLLSKFYYEYHVEGVAAMYERDNYGYEYSFLMRNTVGIIVTVYDASFSLSGPLCDISELDLTYDKEFTYTISKGNTSSQYILYVYYDEILIYSGTITCIDKTDGYFEKMEANINLIVEEFYNGTFSDASTN